MAITQLSPGVAVTETDLTNVTPAIDPADAAFAAAFTWGPDDAITEINSANELASTFGEPDSDTAANWFTAASFLAYAGSLLVIRTVGTAAAKAKDSGSKIEASYYGSRGNRITVSVLDTADFASGSLHTHANLFDSSPTGVGELHVVVSDSTDGVLETFQFVNSTEGHKAASGASDYIDDVLTNSSSYVNSIATASSGSSTITAAEYALVGGVDDDDTDSTNAVDQVVAAFNVVADGDGSIDYAAGPPATGTVIGATDAAALTTGTAVGNVISASAGAGTTIDIVTTAAEVATAGGNHSTKRLDGYALVEDPEAVDIALTFAGADEDGAIATGLTAIAESRTDCVAFASAPLSVVAAAGTATAIADAVVASSWKGAMPDSSFLVLDSGYKSMYDRYNDEFVNVPLNGDIAGLCVFTDAAADPWFSPAGLNRGSIKNVVNLIFSPTKPARDTLYKAGVNPVSSFTGQGTVLFGDKTHQSRPSSFDRINVRRLMIHIEKQVGRAARSLLFEFNDEFTRASFVNMVTPTLRQIQGRRGIQDFLVICDTSNNTTAVVEANQFVGSVLIKPNYSVNFIQLNFVAVRTGVAFSEIVL
jgi:hypothetical protein